MGLHHVVLVVGFPGAGKTIILQELEARARRRRCHVVVHDQLGHWADVEGRTVVRSAEAEDAARVAIAQAPSTLFLDEAALAFPAQGWSPQRSPALNEVLKVGRQARAHGEWRRPGPVSLVAAAQSPAEVHPCLKRYVNRLFIGQIAPTADRDLAWLVDATRDNELALRAPKLPPGRFEVFDPIPA